MRLLITDQRQYKWYLDISQCVAVNVIVQQKNSGHL